MGSRWILVEPGGAEVAQGEAVLETFLGSCVGVALYDPDAGLGGLLHVVLPEGSRRNQAERPFTYATSGIPALVEEMERRGGRRDRMVAHLAGGATLVGTDGGVYPNIGDRNIIACRAVLDLLSIPTASEAVGGTVGRKMQLHLPKGRVKVEISGAGSRRAMARSFSRDELRSLITSALDRLRPDSRVAIRALQLLGREEVELEELEQLIRQDQVLAAAVLRLANSARYGLPRTISRISQAIALLGLATFKRIVMQACIQDLFSSSLTGYHMEEGAFFKHGVVCAELSEEIAGLVTGVHGEEAYLAGLLHDMGKLVLERAVPELFSLVRRLVEEEGITFVAAEREVFGQDHAQVGAQVALRWDLPPIYEEAIGLHHDPAAGRRAPLLVAVVHLANFICNTTGVGMGCDSMANGPRREALELLRFDSRKIMELVEAVPRVVERHG